LYIGSKDGLEKKIIEKLKIPFKSVLTGKLRRYFSWQNFLDLFKIPIGILQSIFILKKFNPDVIFSKGGYVSVPVVIAGFFLRKRIVLHESDISIGLANKICSFFADEILLANEISKKYFKNKKITVVGIPVRKSILSGSKEKARKLLGFDDKKPVLLVMGGSLGAQAINEVIFEVLEEILKRFQVIHIIGKRKNLESNVVNVSNVASVRHAYKLYGNYRSFEYVDENLADFYALTDLIISRAGANALAEFACLQKKVLLIPLSKFASRGDQIENAEDFIKKYGGQILYQENLNGKNLLSKIDDLKKKNGGREFGRREYEFGEREYEFEEREYEFEEREYEFARSRGDEEIIHLKAVKEILKSLIS